MLDLNLIRERTDYVKAALAKKGWDIDFTDLLAKMEQRKALIAKIEEVKAEKNKLSASVLV